MRASSLKTRATLSIKTRLIYPAANSYPIASLSTLCPSRVRVFFEPQSYTTASTVYKLCRAPHPNPLPAKLITGGTRLLLG